MGKSKDYALQKLNQLGIELTKPPDEIKKIVLPKDVTRLTTRELGKLLTKFSGMGAFLEPQVALVEIEVAAVDVALEHYKNKILLSPVCQSHSQASERKSIRDLQPKVVELKKIHLRKNARYLLLKSVLESYNKQLNAISREISRRGQTDKWETK